MKNSGLTPHKVAGRRYTDDATLKIVTDTLLNEVNADLVNQIRELGGHAVPLHTGGLQVLQGRKLALANDQGQPIDLGRVGHVTWVNRDLITNICKADRVPVVPSLAYDEAGNWLNVNADTAASAVAVHLQAEKFVLMTDTAGILRDRHDSSSLITHLDRAGIEELVNQKVIDAGMLPKVEACLDALRAGVKKTHIIDGRLRHSLLLEIYTDVGVGTEIVL
jgi:acetylglutamate kinase